jgi:hypothetical protein
VLLLVVLAVVLRPAFATAQGVLPKPPISPTRAFIASAIVPGLAQSVLGRSTGVLFITVEAIALTMYGKARHDLSIARRFGSDSTPLSYALDPATGIPLRDPETGALQVATWSSQRFGPERINARKTHVEDWVAVLIFNHLFAGIDGFVAAQLWELPAQVEMRASPRGGLTLRAQMRW